MRPAPLSRQALTVAGVLTAFAVCLPNARACPYIIRDSGYIVHEPRPFHLYVFVDHTAPGSAKLSQRVHKAAATEFADANVELKLVPVEADEPTDAVAYYQRAGSPKLPAAVLVSARDDVLLLPGFGAAWSNERSLRQALRRVASSPARQRIIANLVRPWCVVLLGVGTEGAAAKGAESLIGESIESVRETVEKADQRRLSLPYVLRVSLRDPNERALLWSLGLLDADRNAPRVAVLFGRGRRLGPVLKGAQLTPTKLSHLLWLLGQNCTCTSDPAWLLGPVAPLVWPRRQAQQVASMLGFDPNSPMAFSTLSGVWSTMAKPTRQPASPKAEMDLGYVEFSSESVTSKPADEPAAATRQGKTGVAGTRSPTVSAKPKPAVPASPPGTAGTAQPDAENPKDAVSPPKGEQPSAQGEPADAQPAPTAAATAKRFDSSRTAGEPTLSTQATRLLIVFGAVLCLLVLGSGALLLIRRGQS